jgi:voltage-gated potassium channel Kch
MTDDTTIDPAERIARLQARRAASGRPPRAARAGTAEDSPASTPRAPGRTAPPARRGGRRRAHPAAATRWLLGGLSVASFFGIAGTVAAANVANTTSAAAPAPATASAATASTPAAATPVAASATSATQTTKVAPVVHTTTRGS